VCVCVCVCVSRFIGDSTRGKACVPDLIRDCSLHYVLPRTSLTPLLVRGLLSVHHVAYAYAVWKFAYHFLSRDTAAVQQITSELTAAAGKASEAIRALVRTVLGACAVIALCRRLYACLLVAHRRRR
jgi:hypothetical protein